MLDQLYRQTVLDHFKYPRNYGKMEHSNTIRLPYKNPTCGDTMILYTSIEQGFLSEVKFEGSGCSISMASCSIMTEAIYGQTVEEALSLSSVHSLRGRHNCALMGWQALSRILNQQETQRRPHHV